MKAYFLFEGKSSEPQVYKFWLECFFPNITIYSIDGYSSYKTCNTGFYFISGEGYPRVISRIENSVKDIDDIGDVDYFVVVIDSDEDDISSRLKEIYKSIDSLNIPARTTVVPLVQNRCFETMLLGNRRIISSQESQFSMDSQIQDYIEYYDVSTDDPELMGNFDESRFTHSQFHHEYARKALLRKRIRYSKANCSGVMNESYLNQMLSRFKVTGHISSFGNFIRLVNEMRVRLNLPSL